ncbi:MAG: nicotinate-nucleotide--dimethylbenzimidazole phosphoribosyltransferase [Clostridiales bacterium]|jgi:nicotinate-nucleotide--dimethylbenzimidazole phosphoribosyltransferase|nr:nicotinate-nucleotide--dimethylbenzimidazole phosphoribosyltransferase [Clostridiales bacterium]
MRLSELIKHIRPVDDAAYAACAARFSNIAKPLGSLGELERLIARVAAITGSADVNISKKCVLVFCADNGVVAKGVTQAGHEVTTAIAAMLRDDKASVNAMANACGADVFALDIGMTDTVKNLAAQKLMRGTKDMTVGPAMPLKVAERAILLGMRAVKEKKEQRYTLIAAGEVGIGNTATSSAMASVLLGLPVEEVAGRGAGLSDEGLCRKLAAIKKAAAINKPNANDPLDVLHKLGGLDIAAMAGVFLGGALYRVPIVMDGLISSVAALCAVRLCGAAREYILPSHISAEPASKAVLDALGLMPILHAGMRLGEGTGAVALFPLLDMAAAVYNSAATFADIGVEAYRSYP